MVALMEDQTCSLNPTNSSEFSPAMEIDDEDSFATRQQDGTYDEVLEQMESLKSLALAEQEYKVDFFRSSDLDSSGCFKYLNANNEEMTTILCGQVCHSEYGTAIGAAGSYKGDQVRFLTKLFAYSYFIHDFDSPLSTRRQSKINSFFQNRQWRVSA
jgi:hypothetical protein